MGCFQDRNPIWHCPACEGVFSFMTAFGDRICSNCGWFVRLAKLEAERDELQRRHVLERRIEALHGSPGLRVLQIRVELLEREVEELRERKRR